jgi:hypothetical protein
MNKTRRTALSGIIYDLETASDKLTTIGEEEQECVDNLPESLQYSEKADKMQEAIAYIDEAITSINEAGESIRDAME